MPKDYRMIRRLLSRFAPVIYVQIWEDRIKVLNVSSNVSFDDSPLVVIRTSDKGEKLISGIGKKASLSLDSNEKVVNPFSHPRVLFSDFYVAEKLLQHAFQQINNIKYLRPQPKVIVHPMEKTEGGLTMIEKRAFRELALGAGAIEVKLHTGKPLTISSIDFDQLEEDEGFLQEVLNNSSTSSNLIVFMFYLVFIILVVWHFGN
jgi:rod shape-determining protein MreB